MSEEREKPFIYFKSKEHSYKSITILDLQVHELLLPALSISDWLYSKKVKYPYTNHYNDELFLDHDKNMK